MSYFFSADYDVAIVGFGAEIMRVYQAAGLAERIAPTLVSAHECEFVTARRQPLFRVVSDAASEPYGWPERLLFRQPELEELLRAGVAHYPNVTVQLGRQVTSYVQDEAGVTLMTQGPDGECQRVRARYVLGCDGAWSVMRRLSGNVAVYTYDPDGHHIEFFERMMRVNYFGSVYCTHAALPHLRRTRGRVVAVSSLTGKTGVPTRTGYSATKHAMAGFFDSLRIELVGSGVSVTVTYPGFVATEIRERAYGPDGRPLGTGNSPVHERDVMTAEECARQILHAAAGRRREIVMTLRGRVGAWLKLVAPDLQDRIVLRAIQQGK